MTPDQQLLFNELLDHTAKLCEEHILATSSELWLKVMLCEYLLKKPLALLEPRTGKSKNVSKAMLEREVLTLTTVPRPACAGSVDLRVADPALNIELKVRAKFGASEQARYKGYAKDLDNVVSGKADAFIFAADLEPYKRFTNEVSSKKPRKTLDTVLLPSSKATGDFVDHSGTWAKSNMTARTRTVTCSATGQVRIVAGIWL
jgi:hypothetical protein